MSWSGVTRRYHVENTTDQFRGQFVETENVTIDWSASNANGFSFQSSAKATETLFGLVGHELNGVFFH